MRRDMRLGLLWSFLAAATFGFSGTLARPLLDTGWSPAAVVLCRVTIASLVLLPVTVKALRGRWSLLRTEGRLVATYGAVVVAFTQFGYYSAVAHMDVAVALLIEYTAPVLVLGWLWLRHGQRPTRLTAAGAVVAIVGLLFVLDVFSGSVQVSTVGILWALTAMVGCAVYFVSSAQPAALPPVALAGSGMLLGAALLALLGLSGLLEMHGNTAPVHFREVEAPFWVPLVLVGVVATAVAYLSGIHGSRLLGSRLASFVALLEVLAALVTAWLLLGQSPQLIQVLGGLGILAGVVLVKLGEPEETVLEQPDPDGGRVLVA
ncbi:DMT family transporter [Nocardioides sp.]|uniref:DMT family transporter n=1 Tax=Nocardioides sp. TaxID=35761 RepID=UPI002BA6DB16|nr:DMT family transporter [Nocardioides sp.]HSX66596.1 DMT family transporter [Nocardioides sp.]